MRKSCFGLLIGIFLLSGSVLGVKARGLSSTAATRAKHGAVAISSRVRPAGTDVGSLPTALKSVLSQTLGANDLRYRLTRSDRGYRAVNRPNRLAATISLDGFTVRSGANVWGLRLTAWGRGSRLRGVGAGRVVSGSDRVAINRGAIAEWWVNGPLGIEQGWTVANRPRPGGNGGRLTLLLRQSGDLRTQTLSHGRSLAVSTDAGRQVLRYAGLSAYDSTGRRLPAHFEATRQNIRVVVDDKSAVYPVRIDPWVQAAKLTASDGAAYDGLGTSVAVSRDGSTVVVGAGPATVDGNAYEGAVYVFKEPASGWANGTEVAKLTASDGAFDYGLGNSVAVSSDGSTIAAGAGGAVVGGKSLQGAVYVFKEPASGWANETETAKLTPPQGVSSNQLGLSVAMTPDGSLVVAGEPFATVGTNEDQGAVYVYKEPASGWANGTPTAKLTSSVGFAYDQLGYSVAVSSDGKTLVAGSNGGAGIAYVFKEPASGWANGTQTAYLLASDGAAGDELGNSIAVSPDGATVVAGAPGQAGYKGAVYLFEEPASGWANGNQTAKLTASDGGNDDQLGFSVAVSANAATVVAGAYYAKVGGNSQQGAVYVFKEPASGWADATQTARLTASDGAADDNLGASVCVTSDAATIVAGAFGANNAQGAAYVFQGPFWANATPTGSNWYYLSPFGAFNTNGYPWIYHQTLGWLYPVGTSTDSIWFYDPQWDGHGSWWWTSSALFPWVYSVAENEWLYYDAKDSTLSTRWFFNTAGQATTH